SVAVTAASACSWTATTNSAWLTVTGASSGTGNGAVTIGIAANSAAARTGTVTIAGQTFTVVQEAAPVCNVSLSPPSQDVTESAQTISIGVASSCTWTTVSQNSWLTVTGGASGTGSGTVTVAVSANGGAARNGSVAIGNQLFGVSQAASSNPNPWSHQDIGA